VETEPQIIDQYVRTGKARLIYRHLIQLGEATRVLSEASECAGAQGRFWEMRELIYRRQNELFAARSYESIAPLVQELELDETQFRSCLESGEFRQQVEADYAAAQGEGIASRPVMDINGTRVVGAQPFAAFQRVLDAAQ
jgi:protein-disulfide isomerase